MRLESYKRDGYRRSDKPSYTSKATDKMMVKHQNKTGCSGGSIASIPGFIFEKYFCEKCGREI